MGQLERYGLYVLCVVIVLILGVAIWGGDPASASTGPDVELESAIAQSAERQPAVPGQTPRFFDPVPPPAQAPPGDPLDEALDQVTFGHGPATSIGSESPPVTPRETAPASTPTHALRTYRVKKNDTMAGIAKAVLGDERHMNRIRELNPDVDPRRMRPGLDLKLPTAAQLETPPKSTPDSAPKTAANPAGWREYTVKKGDSASEISKKMYGTVRHAKRILEANDISDPTKMQLNAVLRIPPIE